jgi:purine-binding chemotaxis protein CheW
VRRSTLRADPAKSVVGFVVGEVMCAIPIGRVRAVSMPLPRTPAPHATPDIVGMTDYRGELLPLIDLRARFGLPLTEPAKKTRCVVIGDDVIAHPERSRSAGSSPPPFMVGLLVDRVTDVFAPADPLRPAPHLSGSLDERLVLGVVAYRGQLVFVLDAERLLVAVQRPDPTLVPQLAGGVA